MAVDRVPVLKRCRSLGMDPIYLGIDKKSNRESKGIFLSRFAARNIGAQVRLRALAILSLIHICIEVFFERFKILSVVHGENEFVKALRIGKAESCKRLRCV